MNENELSYFIRGAIFKIYQNLGPGLLESVYENALEEELLALGLDVKRQFPVPMFYNGKKMGVGFRIDLLINHKVLVEIKSIENLAEVHHKQVLTYLRLADIRLGLLVNFNTACIEKSIFRKVNGLKEG
ncbi:MAG: GxxExxY protein [Saprospiraceae bacterium]|nr:GxxExxY protein [Saprospiraceae bacterium]